MRPSADSLLIVVGSTLRAEEMDRPLGYWLQEQIRERAVDRAVHVVADFRYLFETNYHELATISIGGPGVNALTHKWLDVLPIVLQVDGEFFLQLDAEPGRPSRASVWGVDHETTKIALATFLEGRLDDLLRASARTASA